MRIPVGLAGKMILANLAIILLAIVFSVTVHTSMLHDHVRAQRERELIAGAEQIALTAVGYLEGDIARETMDQVLSSLDAVLDARIRIVDLEGRIVRGSRGEGDMQHERSFVSRDNLSLLQQGEIVTYERNHPRFDEQMLSVAVPLHSGEGSQDEPVTASLLLHAPLTGIQHSIARLQRFGVLSGAAALLLAAALGYIFFRRISRPLTAMSDVAMHMADGNFHQRVDVDGDDEVGQLARALNHMAASLSRTIDSLQHEKNKFVSTVMSMNDAIMAINAAGEAFLVNPAAADLVGLNDSGEMDDPTHYRHLSIPPQLRDMIADSLESGEESSGTLHLDRNICEVHVTPNVQPGETSRGCVVLLHDISEAHRLEEMRRQFLADASHELRTPLAVVSGFIEALHDGTVPEEDHARYVRLLRSETERLNRLVDDMLDLEQYDAGEISVSPRRVSLPRLLTRTADTMQPAAERGQVHLHVCCPTDLPEVCADPDAVERVILNLIDNALRHTPPGGQVTLRAVLTRAGPIHVSVQDTGEGIAPDKLGHLWERFYKVDESRRRDSSATGLGLAIAKRLIEAHGETIWVNSEPGAGSIFSFTLTPIDS